MSEMSLYISVSFTLPIKTQYGLCVLTTSVMKAKTKLNKSPRSTSSKTTSTKDTVKSSCIAHSDMLNKHKEEKEGYKMSFLDLKDWAELNHILHITNNVARIKRALSL